MCFGDPEQPRKEQSKNVAERVAESNKESCLDGEMRQGTRGPGVVDLMCRVGDSPFLNHGRRWDDGGSRAAWRIKVRLA